jgi:hypothetical protein
VHTKKRSSIVVSFTNVIIICLAQFLYLSILIDKIDMVAFQFLYFPMIIVLTNIFLWFSKFKIEFYQHWIYAYLGFFCSIIVFFFMSLDPSKELPPDETILHADILFVLFVSILQIIILLFLNTITYAFYKGFSVISHKREINRF